jgi:NitT/TauT family transport system ATP-binding protein
VVSAVPDIMIDLQHVTRRFQRADRSVVTALDDVTLGIRRGEFVCIVGPSGHGKTTVLNLIAGLVEPSGGEVRVDDRVVVGPGPDRGIVFQKDSVFPWMRVLANIEYGLRCRGVRKADRRRIAARVLDAVGLSGLDRSWPRELSGGMLKRVAVATVFANGAEVLLLDEPFAALDYVTKRQLHTVLLSLWSDLEADSGRRRTVVFVTHDVDEALILADRIVVMKHGRVVDNLVLPEQRPRSLEVLADDEFLAAKHLLLRHLGLESGSTAEPQRAIR